MTDATGNTVAQILMDDMIAQDWDLPGPEGSERPWLVGGAMLFLAVGNFALDLIMILVVLLILVRLNPLLTGLPPGVVPIDVRLSLDRVHAPSGAWPSSA